MISLSDPFSLHLRVHRFLTSTAQVKAAQPLPAAKKVWSRISTGQPGISPAAKLSNHALGSNRPRCNYHLLNTYYVPGINSLMH